MSGCGFPYLVRSGKVRGEGGERRRFKERKDEEGQEEREVQRAPTFDPINLLVVTAIICTIVIDVSVLLALLLLRLRLLHLRPPLVRPSPRPRPRLLLPDYN